jgi:hypothetical protein
MLYRFGAKKQAENKRIVNKDGALYYERYLFRSAHNRAQQF